VVSKILGGKDSSALLQKLARTPSNDCIGMSEFMPLLPLLQCPIHWQRWSEIVQHVQCTSVLWVYITLHYKFLTWP